MAPLPWPFDVPFMQLALAAGLIVGASAPLVGVFLVQRRLSLVGDGLGHVAFAGVAIGLLLRVQPFWTALVAAVAAAVVIERLRATGRATGDMALALMFYTGIAVGVVVLGLAGALNAGVLAYLFGSILTVTPQDLIALGIVGAVVGTIVVVLRRPLLAIAVDEESARVAGIPVDGLNALFAALTAVTVVAAMRIVGILLVAALMVLPVASGTLVGRSLRNALVWSSAFGIGAAVLGLAGARVWGLAPSGTIVIVAAIAFGVVASGVRFARRPDVPRMGR
jgi:zinc transport system permease protein